MNRKTHFTVKKKQTLKDIRTTTTTTTTKTLTIIYLLKPTGYVMH
jgi:hypothetical protein